MMVLLEKRLARMVWSERERELFAKSALWAVLMRTAGAVATTVTRSTVDAQCCNEVMKHLRGD